MSFPGWQDLAGAGVLAGGLGVLSKFLLPVFSAITRPTNGLNGETQLEIGRMSSNIEHLLGTSREQTDLLREMRDLLREPRNDH